MIMNERAKKQFAVWLKRNDPFLYRVAEKRFNLIKRRSGQLSGPLDFLNKDFFSTIADTVKTVAPSIFQIQSQKKILDVQLERARQGLPPLQTSEYAPTIKVAAEITPEMEAAANRVAVQSVREAMPSMERWFFVAIGVGAYLMLKKKR
jgi:hypothetical protein